jgi:formate dehydrogenase subunit delta
MSNTTETLVRMANQIAANLMHEDDPAAAVAEHIQLYWDPRMKRLIAPHGSDGLSPVAAAAVMQIRLNLQG